MIKKLYINIFLTITLLSSAFSAQIMCSPKVVALSDSDVISIRQDITIAKKIITFLWKKSFSNKFILIAPLFKLLFDKKISVEQLVTEYPSLARYKNKLYKLVALHELIQGTLDVLNQLKRQGVLLVLSSDFAHDVVEYNKTKKPEIFNLFDFFYHETQDTGFKSDAKFYQGLRKAINGYASVTHATEILFVDSNKSHTDAARKANLNISPHLFIGASEFKEELIKKGYLA